jgi:hypothetical protein
VKLGLPSGFKLVELKTYRSSATGDHLTTTGSPPSGYGSEIFEGLIYECRAADGTQPPHSIPLYRRYDTNPDQVTTTGASNELANARSTWPSPTVTPCSVKSTGRGLILEGFLPVLTDD